MTEQAARQQALSLTPHFIPERHAPIEKTYALWMEAVGAQFEGLDEPTCRVLAFDQLAVLARDHPNAINALLASAPAKDLEEMQSYAGTDLANGVARTRFTALARGAKETRLARELGPTATPLATHRRPAHPKLQTLARDGSALADKLHTMVRAYSTIERPFTPENGGGVFYGRNLFTQWISRVDSAFPDLPPHERHAFAVDYLAWLAVDGNKLEEVQALLACLLPEQLNAIEISPPSGMVSTASHEVLVDMAANARHINLIRQLGHQAAVLRADAQTLDGLSEPKHRAPQLKKIAATLHGVAFSVDELKLQYPQDAAAIGSIAGAAKVVGAALMGVRNLGLEQLSGAAQTRWRSDLQTLGLVHASSSSSSSSSSSQRR